MQMWNPSAHQGNPKVLPGATQMVLIPKKTLDVHLDVEETQGAIKGLEVDTCLSMRVCKATRKCYPWSFASSWDTPGSECVP